MLEITGNDIAALRDEDLRSLVGNLCESELRSRGLSTSAVTWGGNQNAADGGIDVRVRIQDGPAPKCVRRVNSALRLIALLRIVERTSSLAGALTPQTQP